MNITADKSDALMHIDALIDEITEDKNEYEAKFRSEVNIANRSYYQGISVGHLHDIQRLERLRRILSA